MTQVPRGGGPELANCESCFHGDKPRYEIGESLLAKQITFISKDKNVVRSGYRFGPKYSPQLTGARPPQQVASKLEAEHASVHDPRKKVILRTAAQPDNSAELQARREVGRQGIRMRLRAEKGLPSFLR